MCTSTLKKKKVFLLFLYSHWATKRLTHLQKWTIPVTLSLFSMKLFTLRSTTVQFGSCLFFPRIWKCCHDWRMCYKVSKIVFSLFMDRSNVIFMHTVCTTTLIKNIKAIQLSLVKIRQIFPLHYSPKAHMNCLTLKMIQTDVFVSQLEDRKIYFSVN